MFTATQSFTSTIFAVKLSSTHSHIRQTVQAYTLSKLFFHSGAEDGTSWRLPDVFSLESVHVVVTGPQLECSAFVGSGKTLWPSLIPQNRGKNSRIRHVDMSSLRITWSNPRSSLLYRSAPGKARVLAQGRGAGAPSRGAAVGAL